MIHKNRLWTSHYHKDSHKITVTTINEVTMTIFKISKRIINNEIYRERGHGPDNKGAWPGLPELET